MLVNQLLDRGAQVVVHDPAATQNFQKEFGDRVRYKDAAYDVLDGADALAINTEWEEYRRPDFREMRRRMNGAAIFDGRNLYEPATMRQAGFHYECIGRPPVVGQ